MAEEEGELLEDEEEGEEAAEEEERVPGWLYGGQVYVDWVACQRTLPALLVASARAGGQGMGKAGEQRLRKLTGKVFELRKLVPDVLFKEERREDGEEEDGERRRGRLTRYVAKTESE